MKLFLNILILCSLLSSVIFALPVEKRGTTVLQALGIQGVQKGYATFFDPATEGGIHGACGKDESDKSEIVAMNLEQYGNENSKSQHCNKEVFIRSGDKFTKAKVNDACPGCKKKSLDLTPTLFKKLASPEKGVVPIEWCFVNDPACADIMKGSK